MHIRRKGDQMDKGIEYILEVARCGGITKAAENLFITPSALSKFVQAREAELQVKLFHRIGKRFVLTQAGEYYVEKSREIERIQRDLETQMSSFSSMSRGFIRIGVQASFTEAMLRRILPELKAAFPGLRVIMHERTIGELVQMIKSRQLDVMVGVMDKREQGFEYKVIHQCELVMAALKDHPAIQMAVEKPGFRYPWIDLSLCADQPNVMLMPGSPYRTYADSLYGLYQLKPNIAYQLGSSRSGLACVAYTGALMVTLDHMIFNNQFDQEILPLSVGEKPLIKELAMACLENSILGQEIQVFHRICRTNIL